MSPLLTDLAVQPQALVIFAHGAGADMHSRFMSEMTKAFIANHMSVVRFNFDYMNKRLLDGKKRPPERMPKLLRAFEQVIEQVVNDQQGSLPVYLAGKSMGGRVAATITSEVDDVINANVNRNIISLIKGVVCLGYPFHPQGNNEKLRLTPLQKRILPLLIIQGERDKLGDKTEVLDYNLSDCCDIHFLPDGDHDLKPRIKSGFTHQEHINEAAQQAAQFIRKTSDG